MYEIFGPGAALFDYDNDGDLDVYFVQGGSLKNADAASRVEESSDRLFRNDLPPGGGTAGVLRFTDVTQLAGIRSTGYGMGVATGDFDGDGWTDLYVTNFGPNTLWRNMGNGSFEDVTQAAGVAGNGSWSTSALMIDVDSDGWQDLFVANYVAEDPANPRQCSAPNSARDYCSPLNYPAVPNRLYRNTGKGTFVDASETSGIAALAGTSLGVVADDFDGDGLIDLFVANDAMDNELWINRGALEFSERALMYGAAVNGNGEPEAGMGVTAGDYDGDGDADLFLTHLKGETNTLYVNDGRGRFTDRTTEAGLGSPSLPYTGFATGWFDVDNDGWLDLFIANGAVRNYGKPMTGEGSPLAERNQLFRSRGDGSFVEMLPSDSRPASESALGRVDISRGTAFGDIDNDGDTDLLVTNNNGPARLLINEYAGGHWLGLSFRKLAAGASVSGVRVIIDIATARNETRRLWRTATTHGSYLSAHDPRILVGVGAETKIDRVQVVWPDGLVEHWRHLEVDRYHELVHGSGSSSENNQN